jgi:hypothetical protein
LLSFTLHLSQSSVTAASVEEELDDWSHPGVREEDEEMLLDV